MFFRRCLTTILQDRLSSALLQKPGRQCLLQMKFRKTNFVRHRNISTTFKSFEEKNDESKEISKLEKLRLDEILSANQFQCQDSKSAEYLQSLDIKCATQLYEVDVAQNQSFSQADAKAGTVFNYLCRLDVFISNFKICYDKPVSVGYGYQIHPCLKVRQ
jgi:hypothetical protein